MKYVKLTGHSDPSVFTTEVILDRDDETGEVTKAVRQGEPTQLDADTVKALEAKGFIFEDSSKDEVEDFAEARVSGPAADVVGSGPVLDASSNPPSSVTAVDQSKSGDSRKNS